MIEEHYVSSVNPLKLTAIIEYNDRKIFKHVQDEVGTLKFP